MYKKPAEEVNHYTVNLIVQCLFTYLYFTYPDSFVHFHLRAILYTFANLTATLVIYVKIRLILTLYAHNNFLFRCFNKLRSIHKMGKNCVELDIWSTLYTKPMIVNLFKIFFDVAKHYTI